MLLVESSFVDVVDVAYAFVVVAESPLGIVGVSFVVAFAAVVVAFVFVFVAGSFASHGKARDGDSIVQTVQLGRESSTL